MPWPPGSVSEPSCSQGLRGTGLPEPLLFLPDPTPLQLSFVLLGVGADLNLGVQDPASGPLRRVLHATRSPHSSGTRTGCCCLLQCFPRGCVRAGCTTPWETRRCPSGPEGRFQLGACELLLLPLACSSSGERRRSPLQQPPRRLTLELGLISLTRPVILSSSPGTFQSILGATAT